MSYHSTFRGPRQPRPTFGRGAGGVGKSFDARQKIGTNDVRHRMGGAGAAGATGFQMKDAREKLGQKDARFKIRGRGGAGGVQDARQMINSRKQGQIQYNPGNPPTHALPPQLQSTMPSQQIHPNMSVSTSANNTRHFAGQGQNVRDARDRLSLKRSFGGTQPSEKAGIPFKITKTIQQRPVGLSSGTGASTQPLANDVAASKQIKITTSNDILSTRGSGMRSQFSLSSPITKVVKNDAYTAPRPPVPVAPTRPSTSTPASRPSGAALQQVSRTLQQSTTAPSTAAAAPLPTFSPLEGTKITVNNLHPRVTEEDIVELFCVCGALKRARLVKVGVAEVVFVRKEDAVSAYRKYNNRCLDGQPMKCNLHIQGNVITSDQPILLRLSDTPGSGSSTKKDGLPLSLSRPAGQRASTQPTPEVDPQTILKALFKSTAQSPTTPEPPNSQATAFRIKI
ncbi:unnamed protein product [Knipowitschia caucasica]|uniref:RRM domain-containing protein n=1 Tax=Knipowitschia caucasica TaxID=637954 RepID=A0AAV2KGI7_KNICA